MKEIFKLKRTLEKIANGPAPASMLDDLKRIYGYDPRGLAQEALSALADLAEMPDARPQRNAGSRPKTGVKTSRNQADPAGLPDEFKTVAEIRAFLKRHPGAFVRQWEGSTLSSFGFSVHLGEGTPVRIPCARRAGRAALRSLQERKR